MRGTITAGLLLALITSPALASRHPTTTASSSFDAVAAYPDAEPKAYRRVHRHHYVRHERHVEHKLPTVHVTAQKPLPAAADMILGKMLGIAEGWADGIATALPILANAPARLRGTLEIDGLVVAYGSGGAGYGIPYGQWAITTDVGSWGARHGALAINNDAELYDPRLGRDREGMEIHADMSGGDLVTEGCVAIERAKWGAVRSKIAAMIDSFGHAFLSVTPQGARIVPVREAIVVITPTRTAVAENRPRHSHRRYAGHRRHYARHGRVHYAGA